MDALPNLSIIDPVSFGQSGVNKPVGTGPFTFGEYAQGDHLTLQKNPNYWDTGKPYLDELRFRIFTDPQSMMTEFDGGALDVAMQPTLIDWVRTQKEGKAQALINQNSGNYMGAAFNTTQPPTDNKLVRQALQFALDRQRMVSHAVARCRAAAHAAVVLDVAGVRREQRRHVRLRPGQGARAAGAGRRVGCRAGLQLSGDLSGLWPGGPDLAS